MVPTEKNSNPTKKIQLKCHLVDHKYDMELPVIEPGPLQREFRFVCVVQLALIVLDIATFYVLLARIF